VRAERGTGDLRGRLPAHPAGSPARKTETADAGVR
jgi:hypothetical protein